ncbi:MAG TPA: large conductance mechanosensitive channel protein MscL [Acidimicrobiia bacterium]|nr:large conductance mechanosensitive channel protein MscL [Acidimicrobiia bacterium]
MGEQKKGVVKEFREFIASGNMIQLAVAVILGAAIGVAIKAFTDGIIMQIVAAVFGKPDFSDVTIVLRHNVGTDANGNSVNAVLQIGTFVNALIALVLTGLVLFAIVKMYNTFKRKEAAENPGPTEIELLTDIRDALRTRV